MGECFKIKTKTKLSLIFSTFQLSLWLPTEMLPGSSYTSKNGKTKWCRFDLTDFNWKCTKCLDAYCKPFIDYMTRTCNGIFVDITADSLCVS